MTKSAFRIATGVALMLCASSRVEASALLQISVGSTTITCSNQTAAGVAACLAAGFETILGSPEITWSGSINGVFVGRISVSANQPGTSSMAYMLVAATQLHNVAGAARTVTVDFVSNNFTNPANAGSVLASQTANWTVSGNGDSQAFLAWTRNSNALLVEDPPASGTATTPECITLGGLSQACGTQSEVVPATTTVPFALAGQAVIRLSNSSVGSFTTSSLFTNSSNPVVASDAAVSLGLEREAPRRFLYTIAVTNGGPALASGITVTDTIPAGTRFVSATPSQGSCVTPAPGAVGTMTCNLGSVAAGTEASVQLLVDVTATGQATVTNTVVVSSASPDLNTTNNTATLQNRWGEPQ